MKKIYFFFTLLLFLNFNVNAQVIWTGAGDGSSWTDTANWDTGTVPTASDLVEINSDVTITSASAVSAAQVKITGTSAVALDLDLNVGTGTVEEHTITVSANSSLTLGAAGSDRTFTITPEATKQGIAIFGSSENAVVIVAEGTTVNFATGNNGINLTGVGSSLTNEGTLSFASEVKNAFKVVSSVTNNGSIIMGSVTGDAIAVGEGGSFVNNGEINATKPSNDAVEIEGGTFTNNGTITAVVKDDAGSGNNVIAVGSLELTGTFINGIDGIINADAGIAENARAVSINEMGTLSNLGTITVSGGNEGSRFYSRGNTTNEFGGIIDLTDGRMNINLGTLTNNGLVKTIRDGSGIFSGETTVLTNNAFIDYATSNNFASGMGVITDNGISINANAVNIMGSCTGDLAEQPYEFFYEGNSIGTADNAGMIDFPATTFISPDSVALTTSIPGVEFFIKNYCAESILDMIDAVNNLELAALEVYPTLAAAGTTLTVDLTALNITTAEMTLTDFTGKKLQTQTLSGGEINHVESINLNTGIFFMHVYTEGKVLMAKLILQ